MVSVRRSAIILICVMFLTPLGPAIAGPLTLPISHILSSRLNHMLKTHQRLRAAEAELEAAREKARVALGDWFPTLDLRANRGWGASNQGFRR